MKKIQLLLVIFLFGILTSCESDGLYAPVPLPVDSYLVASHKVVTIDPETQKVGKSIAVKLIGAPDIWYPLDKSIKGFNYEEGFEYVITVQANDSDEKDSEGNRFYYILLKIDSKIEKESEGLPEKFEYGPE